MGEPGASLTADGKEPVVWERLKGTEAGLDPWVVGGEAYRAAFEEDHCPRGRRTGEETQMFGSCRGFYLRPFIFMRSRW